MDKTYLINQIFNMFACLVAFILLKHQESFLYNIN